MTCHQRLLSLLPLAALIASACGRPSDQQDLRGELARISGQMASLNDLRQVRFEDLDTNGVREVILVYGPRELLDFDVFYQEDGDRWRLTPMVNDQNNPREFVGARLDSVGDGDGDGLPEIVVTSRLYDGNTMVKELTWTPAGYRVVHQRTELTARQRIEPPKPARREESTPVAAAPETAAPAAAQPSTPATPPAEVARVPEQKPAAPAKQPEPKRPAVTPAVGSYLVKKGDTIFGIAAALGVTPEALEQHNNNQLARRGLQIGQRIAVPVPGSRSAKVSVRIEQERYTVRPGDTLISIARRFEVSIEALQSWNQDLTADGAIKVGQNLSVHQAVIDIKG